MGCYLDKLEAAATQDKDALEQLVNNNTNLVTQLAALTKKFERFSSQENSSSSRGTPVLNRKKMKVVQCDKNGHCHAHGHLCVKIIQAEHGQTLELTTRRM